MTSKTLLPNPELLLLDYFSTEGDQLVLVLSARRETAECPSCQQPAERVHSRYQRRLADRPWNGVPVRLQLHTRRWFCDTPSCPQAIFTERLPGVAERYARRTDSQRDGLTYLAYVLGGEGGARAAAHYGMAISPDTLLLYLRARGPFQGAGPRVLGVDDFAFARGQRYGTLLLDLTTGQPIDVLPDREAETLAQWLKAHPGVEIISRDRGGAYACGAREGAPQAQQVADRFHLLKNLTEALGELLGQERDRLRTGADRSTPPPPPGRTPTEQAARADRREPRAARYAEVVRLRQAGWTQRAIAEAVGLSVDTVRRWLAAPSFPERKTHARRPSPVEPYAAYLQQRWREGGQNCRVLWEELRARGFTGKYYDVWLFTQRWRHAETAETPPSAETPPVPTAPTAARTAAPPQVPFTAPTIPTQPAPRTVLWWLLRPEKRTADQRAYVEWLEAGHAPIRNARLLVQDFFQLVRQRNGDGLAAWVARVEASAIGPLRKFARGLQSDWEAVLAGVTLPWSNGPTEGQINRLKLLKRQMFGRAGWELLRGRVLPQTVRP